MNSYGPSLKDRIAERAAQVSRMEDEYLAADGRGELWTIQAALYPQRAFVLIYQGHVQDMRPLESQHGGCAGFLGPQRTIGTAKEAQAYALGLFTVDEITLRVIR